MGCALVVIVAVSGCAAAAPTRAMVPAEKIISVDDLPDRYAVTELSLADLVAADNTTIEEMSRATVTPEFCRPTADAALTKQLTAENSAVLAARAPAGSMVQLVTTARRDVGADVATTSGRCARTRTVLGPGAMAGTTIDTEYSTLDGAAGATSDRVEQLVMTRTDGRTTLTDGGVSNRIGYAAYAILRTASGDTFTMQITASGLSTPAANPPTMAVAPMSDSEFVTLVGKALATAER